jgi:putative phage-type endonuclease
MRSRALWTVRCLRRLPDARPAPAGQWGAVMRPGSTSTPAADLLGVFEPGSAEWLAQRTNALGGSEVAPVLGLSPFESRFSLWHRKAGMAGPVEENVQMEWGKRLEPVVADKYADAHPEFEVATTGMWRNRVRPWQVVSPDRLVFDRETLAFVKPVEIKISIDGLGWGEPGTDEIPVYYRCQALWYLDGLGAEHGHVPDLIDVAVLVNNWDYREYQVRYDMDEARLLRDAAQEFLSTVDRGERPNVDSHTETYRVIREMHPNIDPRSVELNPDIAVAYLAACGAYKAAEDEKRRCAATVADAMGDAWGAKHLDEVIATRVSKGGGTPYVKAVPVKRAGQKVSDAA